MDVRDYRSHSHTHTHDLGATETETHVKANVRRICKRDCGHRKTNTTIENIARNKKKEKKKKKNCKEDDEKEKHKTERDTNVLKSNERISARARATYVYCSVCSDLRHALRIFRECVLSSVR